jgi:trehalose 2-sulfotransferase
MRAVRAAGTSTNGVFAAKLHWSHLQWLLRTLRLLPGTPAADLDATVVASWFPGPCYVHLTRRDRARQAISMWRALATDVWWMHEGDPAPADPSSIDLQEVRWLEDLIDEHEASWDLYFNRHSIVPLEIAYEDLAADRDAAVRRIAAFIGVDLPADFVLAPSRLQRQAGPETEIWLAAYLDRRSELAPKPSRSGLKVVTRPLTVMAASAKVRYEPTS